MSTKAAYRALETPDTSKFLTLPQGWVWSVMDDVLSAIEAGKSFTCEERPPLPTEVGVVKVSSVTWGRFDELESKTVIDSERINPDYFIENGDFLFSRANTIELVGRCVIVQNITRRLMLSDKILRFRLVGVLPQWILFYLSSMFGRYEIERLATGNQQSMRNIGQDRIRKLRVPLAPLPEQHRIVAAIETQFTRLDAAVATLRRVQANLKRYRASVLQAACEGRLVPREAELARAEGRSYEPADQLLQRMLQERRATWEAEQLAHMQAQGKVPKDERWKSKYKEQVKPDTSDLRELPEGWVWTTVEQAGYVQLGRQRAPQHHHGEHMRPYLRVANVFEDRIDTSDILHMNFTPEEFRTYSLQYGDVLLNEGQSLELVGRPAIYRDEVPDACFQNTLIRFRPYEGLLSEFALCVFRSYLHNGRFQRIAKWTTNIAHLGAGRLAELEFPLPPVAEQYRIITEIERRFSFIDKLETAIAVNLKRAERLRQAILKRAFEGKLVPQDPTGQ